MNGINEYDHEESIEGFSGNFQPMVRVMIDYVMMMMMMMTMMIVGFVFLI